MTYSKPYPSYHETVMGLDNKMRTATQIAEKIQESLKGYRQTSLKRAEDLDYLTGVIAKIIYSLRNNGTR